MHWETDQRTHLLGKHRQVHQRPHTLVHSPMKRPDTSHYQTSTHQQMREFPWWHIHLDSLPASFASKHTRGLSPQNWDKQIRNPHILEHNLRNRSGVSIKGKCTHNELSILTAWACIPQQLRELTSWDLYTKSGQRAPLLLQNSWAHKFWNMQHQRQQRHHTLVQTLEHKPENFHQQTHTHRSWRSRSWVCTNNQTETSQPGTLYSSLFPLSPPPSHPSYLPSFFLSFQRRRLHLFLFLKIFLGHIVQPVGILVPQPGIEPRTSAVKAWSPNHWITREFPIPFLEDICLSSSQNLLL